MANIAVLNAISAGEIAARPVVDGASSVARALSFGRGLPGVEKVVMLVSGGAQDARKEAAAAGMGSADIVSRDTWSQADLLQSMKTLSDGARDVFYFFADCPLLDPEVSLRMYQNHVKYFADYTFADGYPLGLCPEIMTAETAGRLASMAKASAPAGRETIFDLIKLDINSFDIETELAPRDQRLLRVSLTADTARNFMLLERVVGLGGRSAAVVMDILDAHPGIMRTLPAFFPLQIVEGCPQACAYCPYPKFGGDILNAKGFMPVESFTALVGSISRLCTDAVIDVSLWGEPALHPEIERIVETALQEPGISLVIETSGIGWNPEVISRISRLPRKPVWIVSLDAKDPAVYTALRGEGCEEARKTADRLLELFPGSAYVQAVRMKENEEDLESFYKSWKERTTGIIIQKYDDFCGFLPQRKVADLSPLTRAPCWHLKRDMAILMDGRVPACREDVRASRILGNAFTDDLGEIWRRGEELHARHLKGEHPGICASCDEWYTYNF